jgi:hypothetical protein
MAAITARPTPALPRAFLVAGLLGCLHAAFSLYWATGGTVLAWSLGADLVATFRGREWVLAPISALKLVAALAPLFLASKGWPGRRVTRSLCWLGAAVLVLWGGLNTMVANLVLVGAIHPSSGFDRAGMIGHAWLWDPLFLAWGTAVVLGLRARARASGTRRDR